jgi:hypothetical protein
MADRCRCRPFYSGVSRQIDCSGCRRKRHSAGARECARAQWFDQRSERHRQRGKGGAAEAARSKAGSGAARIVAGGHPVGPGASKPGNTAVMTIATSRHQTSQQAPSYFRSLSLRRFTKPPISIFKQRISELRPQTRSNSERTRKHCLHSYHGSRSFFAALISAAARASTSPSR